MFISLIFFVPDKNISRGASALSPSRKTVAITNLKDGIDWYDVERRKYTRTTVYNIGSKYIVEIHFIGENAIVAGHSGGALILATPLHRRNPGRFKFLAGMGIPKKQVLTSISQTAGIHNGRYVIIACSNAVGKPETIEKCVTVVYEKQVMDEQGRGAHQTSIFSQALVIGASSIIALYDAVRWLVIPSPAPSIADLRMRERTTLTVTREAIDTDNTLNGGNMELPYKQGLWILATFDVVIGAMFLWDRWDRGRVQTGQVDRQVEDDRPPVE
ncbi:hypothetical protein Hypma_014669 [Hypsizygus marmoreus]|uniref:Uncharacterized protein n=1 Tax=Hypsizygus marmoreus TaxID=39966 RepID=A0A369JH54_HYPMA|nr:hypothetical protein Hypma_014669 [Hypsizygus marmoreus]